MSFLYIAINYLYDIILEKKKKVIHMNKSNELSYYTQHTFYNLSLLLVNGSIIQSFLIELGIAPDLVSAFVSVSSIVQLSVMMMLAKKTEHQKNIIKTYAMSQLFTLATIVTCLILCFVNSIPVNGKFLMVMISGIITNIGLGFLNILSYKVIYHIIDMNRYGLVTGVSGICIGSFGIIASAFFSYFIKTFPFINVMTTSFTLGIILILVSFFLTIRFKDNGYKSTEQKKEKVSLFKYKPFRVLFIPNLLRGFTTGFFTVIVAIGYELKILDSITSGYLLIITNTATLLGSFLYSLTAKKKIDNYQILISSILIFILVPFFGILKNPYSFLALYGLTYTILQIINYAVPVLITRIVDYNIIGQYTSWRMMLHTLGTSATGFLTLPLVKLIGAVPTFLTISVCQLISGIVYFTYSHHANK